MGHANMAHREQQGPPQPRPPIAIAANSATSENPRPVSSKLVVVEEEYPSSEEDQSMAATKPSAKSKPAVVPAVLYSKVEFENLLGTTKAR